MQQQPQQPQQQVVYMQTQPAQVVVAPAQPQGGCCNHVVRNKPANIVVGVILLVGAVVAVITNIVLIVKCQSYYRVNYQPFGLGVYGFLCGTLMLVAGIRGNACCDTAALVLNILGTIGAASFSIYFGTVVAATSALYSMYGIFNSPEFACTSSLKGIRITFTIVSVILFVLHLGGSIIGCISCCKCCNSNEQGGAVIMQSAPAQPAVQYQQVKQ